MSHHLRLDRMEVFQRLGETIREQWNDVAFDRHLLPAIACSAMADMPLSTVGAADILRWVRTCDELPRQEDIEARFAEPPVTLYWHPEFFIAAHFWHSRRTSIHEHAFTGAFMVLEGSSLQERHGFELSLAIDERLRIGEVRFVGAEVLTPGRVQPIHGGDRFIHAIAPLDTPTLSLVVRTRQAGEFGPQYDYSPPHVSFDPLAERSDPVHQRRLQCLALLAGIGSADYEDAGVDTIRNASAYTGWCVLLQAVPLHNREKVDLARLVATMRECHGSWADKLMPCLVRAEQRYILASRHPAVENSDHRFFLNALGCVRERDGILRLIAERIPGRDPRDTVMEWVSALSGTDLVGIEFNELNTAIFRHLLDGVSPDDIPARLAESYDPDDIESQRSGLARHIDRIRHAELFECLLT